MALLHYVEPQPGNKRPIGETGPGIKPMSPALQEDSLPSEPQGSPISDILTPII